MIPRLRNLTDQKRLTWASKLNPNRGTTHRWNVILLCVFDYFRVCTQAKGLFIGSLSFSFTSCFLREV